MPTSVQSPTQQAAQNYLENANGESRELPKIMIFHDGYKISASAESLFNAIASTRRFFYRGGTVVEVVEDPDEGFISKPLSAAAFVSRFDEYVNFTKSGAAGTDPIIANISEQQAKIYLKTTAAQTCLPHLNGILNCPMLVEKDGRLIEVNQGYNLETGYFVTSAQPAENVELAFAVGILSKILCEFDFVTPGDRSRAIASMLTPALKLGGFIKGAVPVEVAEADQSQSGKGYRQKLIGAIYNQKLALVTNKKGGVGSFEESICEHLVKGRVFIQLDNWRGRLDSELLESFITADGSFPARVPFLGSMSVNPGKFILFISSNGFEATKDLTNRSSIIGIRKRVDHQFEQFEGGRDLLEFSKFIQPVLIGAVFTVIKEWHRQGKPRTSEKRHDFYEWCQVLDWIVQNLFDAAPLMEGHDEAKRIAVNTSLSFLRTLSIKLRARHAIDQALAAGEISQICIEEDLEIPGVKMEEQTVEQGPQQIGKIMKPLFKGGEEFTFGEFKVSRSSQQQLSEQGHPFTAYRYTFQQVTPATSPTAVPATPQNC
jgi:hypothetical protein